MASSYPTYAALIASQKSDLLTFCDYLNWAYVSYVDLTDAETLEIIRITECANFVSDYN